MRTVKPRIGRPPEPDARHKLVAVRVKPAERIAWGKAAEAAGVSLGEWMRFTLNLHARADITRRAK